jgi:hypothetical protein
MQETGGTRATIEAGIAMVRELLPIANSVQRQSVPARHIKVGLQCGGLDGFSSLTANPALGAAMDILVRHGGTAILSETLEIYGVEDMLTRRAAVSIGGSHAESSQRFPRRGRATSCARPNKHPSGRCVSCGCGIHIAARRHRRADSGEEGADVGRVTPTSEWHRAENLREPSWFAYTARP